MATAADQILDLLDAWGIELIFGCPGTTETPFLDALVDRRSPELVLCTHEVAAVNMADGYARATGQPGVVLLHTNAGLGNAMGQIQNAWSCRTPLVVLCGMKSTVLQGRSGFTTAPDIRGMVDQFCKWSWVAMRPESLAENVLRALKIATSPPHGVTFVGMPEDLLAAAVAGPLPAVDGFRLRQRVRPDGAGVQEAAQLLARAQRPLLVFGEEVARDDAFDEAVALAEALGAAVCTETRAAMGRLGFPMDHRQYLGPFAAGTSLVNAADVIFLCGTRAFAEFLPPRAPYLPLEARVIHLHIDPWEVAKIYPTQVGLIGDTKSGLADVLTALKAYRNPDFAHTAAGRAQAVADIRSRQTEEYEDQVRQVWDHEPIRVERLVAELARVLDEDISVIGEGVTSTDALLKHVRLSHEQSWHAAGPGGAMPWGMGAAVGYKLGAPERKVLAFVGDGVFLMGCQALSTAVKRSVPVAYVVVNNSTYMAVRAGLLRHQGRAAAAQMFPGTDIGGPDCAAIARGFGATSRRITRPAEIGPALVEALAHPGPYVLEVVTDAGDAGDIRRS